MVVMAAQGFVSTWLPLQQEHEVGAEAAFDVLRGDIDRGPMWTDAHRQPGNLALSPWQTLPTGDYTCLLQLWQPHGAGLAVGTLLAEDEAGQVLGSTPVVTRAHDFGDWQRDLVRFRLTAPARVRVRFRYDGQHPLWTGLLHVTRGAQRPVYVIGHNRNTPAQVDRSLAAGANAIEVDFSYREGKLLVAEVFPFPGWEETSQPAEWLRHVQTRRGDWAFLYFDCKPNHVPDSNFYQFGVELAGLVRDAGIDPRCCLFSVSDPASRELFRGVRDNGFAESACCMDGLHNSQPRQAPPDLWPKTALEEKLAVIGLGRIPLDLTTPLALWWPATQAAVAARDAAADYPKKVIYWTLAHRDGIRKMLDLGVDGIIAEQEGVLCEVLQEEPYRSFCRRADPSKWEPLTAHGVDESPAPP
jgi:hypothetical protein